MKELTYKDWEKNQMPREMWVWDNYESSKIKMKVIYILNSTDDTEITFPVITLNSEERNTTMFMHCAEIELPKMRRMTHQELAKWLFEGIKEGKLREWKSSCEHSYVHITCAYQEEKANCPVDEGILIREDNGEWREPLIEEE